MLNIEAILYSAIQLLISKVFSLRYSSISGNECAIVLHDDKNICWYLCSVEYGTVKLMLYTGFTHKSFAVFMNKSYYGLKRIENEIDHELLYTNISGMILFKLHNDLRHEDEKFKYSSHEKVKSVPHNNIDTLFLGRKNSDTILYLGYHTM